MSLLKYALTTFDAIESVSRKNDVKISLHPASRILITLLFILTLISINNYEPARLIPFFIFPLIVISMYSIPLKFIFNVLLLVSPFILILGIANPILDRREAMLLGNFHISYGMISYISIILKFILSVSASLILIMLSGIQSFAYGLQSLKVPQILVTQFLFVYRYVRVLLEEALKMTQARLLRSGDAERLPLSESGHFMGFLLFRSLKRAERIYQAMLSRGFSSDIRLMSRQMFRLKDMFILLLCIVFFIFIKSYNLPQLLGTIVLELL